MELIMLIHIGCRLVDFSYLLNVATQCSLSLSGFLIWFLLYVFYVLSD